MLPVLEPGAAGVNHKARDRRSIKYIEEPRGRLDLAHASPLL